MLNLQKCGPKDVSSFVMLHFGHNNLKVLDHFTQLVLIIILTSLVPNVSRLWRCQTGQQNFWLLIFRIRTSGSSVGQFGFAAEVRAVGLLAPFEGGEPDQVANILVEIIFSILTQYKNELDFLKASKVRPLGQAQVCLLYFYIMLETMQCFIDHQ